MTLAESVAALPPLKETIAKHEIFTKKSLGQHFLLDLNLTRRIARAAGELKGRTVIEVGPGPGGLTRALFMEGAEAVTAIEKDWRCIEALEPLVQATEKKLTLLPEDATKTNITHIANGKPVKIIANLPYNVGTVMLFNWLEDLSAIEKMTLMFQKEVAERIVAKPNNKQYGRLSVMAQWLCDVKREFDVPPQAFSPPPKVVSTVISLIPRAGVERELFPKMELLCQKLFGQRRKMLRVSLKQITPEPEKILKACNIAPELRPENLTVDQFVAMARLCA